MHWSSIAASPEPHTLYAKPWASDTPCSSGRISTTKFMTSLPGVTRTRYRRLGEVKLTVGIWSMHRSLHVMLWVDQAGQAGSPPGRALYLSPFLVTGSRTFDNMVNPCQKACRSKRKLVSTGCQQRKSRYRTATHMPALVPSKHFKEGLPSRKAELNLPKSDLIQVFRKSQRTLTLSWKQLQEGCRYSVLNARNGTSDSWAILPKEVYHWVGYRWACIQVST